MPACPSIYVSTGIFGRQSLSDTLAMARDWNIRGLELTGNIQHEADPADRLSAAQGFDFLVHNYFPPPRRPFVLNLASEDPEILALSRAHCRAAVDLSQALGGRWFSVHAGFAAIVAPEHLGRQIPAENRADKGRATEIFETSIRDLVAYAGARGVGILVENNVVTKENLVSGRNDMLLLATSGELADFARRIDSEFFGLLIDFGHAHVTATSLDLDRDEFLAEVAPFTRGLHLSDNDGLRDSNGPFDRSSWVAENLRTFDPDYVVVEAYHLNREELASCIDAIEVGFA